VGSAQSVPGEQVEQTPTRFNRFTVFVQCLVTAAKVGRLPEEIQTVRHFI
jgi:hypothetical protein